MVAKVRAIVRLENDRGYTIMDPERFQILKAVDQSGSMSKAAARLSKQFRRVWTIIKETEAHFGFALVETGPNGSKLTAEGQRLLSNYEELMKSCKRSTNSKFRKLFFT